MQKTMKATPCYSQCFNADSMLWVHIPVPIPQYLSVTAICFCGRKNGYQVYDYYLIIKYGDETTLAIRRRNVSKINVPFCFGNEYSSVPLFLLKKRIIRLFLSHLRSPAKFTGFRDLIKSCSDFINLHTL